MANDSSTGIPPIPPRYTGLRNAETFGRLSSKPNSPDVNALAYFAAWVSVLPKTVDIVSGNKQGGAFGTVLDTPLVVRITDNAGRPLVGTPVTFQVRELDARIEDRIAITVLTGPDGRATASRWRLGGADAKEQHVDVSAEGARATFVADVSAPDEYSSHARTHSTAKSQGSRTS